MLEFKQKEVEMNRTIKELFDLSGKTAMVTGGAMGIGKGIALRLAEAGANVVIGDINMEVAGGTVKEIEAAGGRAKAVKADTSVIAEDPKTVQSVIDAFGDIDILVNNAGIYRFMPALNMTEEMWQKTMSINLTGVFFLAKAAANAMIKAGHGGKIVNVASIDAFRPTGNLAHYDASKGGVVMMTKALAQELAKYGINVNAVAPGGINTPGAARMIKDAKLADEQAKAMQKEFIDKIPLHRMGEPDDVAGVVLFLASQASDYMVGSIVRVDGGALLV